MLSATALQMMEKSVAAPRLPCGRAVSTRKASADLDRADGSTTTCHPHNVTGPHGARVAIGQRVAGCQWRYWPWETSDPVGVAVNASKGHMDA